MRRSEELERLSSIETDECVLWPHARDRLGYGRLKPIGGGTGLTHRLSCIKAHGMPPADKQHAAHSCNNPPCLNPRHLRWDTAVGNAADRVAAGTALLGDQASSSVLTSVQVWWIRFFNRGGLSQSFLARHYGVNQSTVQRIVSGKNWSHLCGTVAIPTTPQTNNTEGSN